MTAELAEYIPQSETHMQPVDLRQQSASRKSPEQSLMDNLEMTQNEDQSETLDRSSKLLVTPGGDQKPHEQQPTLVASPFLQRPKRTTREPPAHLKDYSRQEIRFRNWDGPHTRTHSK